MKTLAIIGGGAAGLAAAIAAAKTARGQHPFQEVASSQGGASDFDALHIVVYEADERVGRSILVTGNGRCNFSNASIDPSLYRHADFVSKALCSLEKVMDVPSDSEGIHSEDVHSEGVYHGDAVKRFFTAIGLVWREEREGRLYPWANKASSVVDVLRLAALDLEVEVAGSYRVDKVEPPRRPGKPYTLHLEGLLFHRADAVVVACGGAATPELLPHDVSFTAFKPCLGPLRTDTSLVRKLDNIRVKCTVGLWRESGASNRLIAQESGEILFRKYGVSGIAVYNLSRFAQAGDELAIDLLTFLPLDALDAYAANRCRQLGQLAIAEPLSCGMFLRGLLIMPLIELLLPELGFSEDYPCTPEVAAKVLRGLKDLRLRVRDIAGDQSFQVHRGGYDPTVVNADTMELQNYQGIYLAGECLDVDAPCGGYNLHWAWATGLLAGTQAVRALRVGALEDALVEGTAGASDYH